MIRVRLAIEHGFILSLAELRNVLRSMDPAGTLWTLVPPPAHSPVTKAGTPKALLVRIRLRQPEFINPSNDLVFMFPIVLRPQGGPAREEEVYVCLHPETANLEQAGLYFEGEELKQDPLRDWDTFWPPLKEALLRNLPPPD